MIEGDISDDALIAGMAMGHEEAAVAFVRRYQRRVFGLALSMVRDPELASDIAQEAFLRAWRHASVFDSRRGPASRWLLTITRNLAVDAVRLRRAAPTDPQDPLWLNLEGQGRPLDELVVSKDAQAKVRAALALLPAEQARAIVLASMYGYTAVEIGECEGVPVGTAKSRVRRGLERLRDQAGVGRL